MISQHVPSKNIMIVAMNRSLIRILGVTVAAVALLSACETIGPAIGIKPSSGAAASPGTPGAKPAAGGAPGALPVAPSQSSEQAGLKDGIELYNKGAFNDAIKRLGAPDVAGGAKATQLQALKFTAFSYCVTMRQTLCRQSFEKAFKLDPAFDLAPGEHGHPLWGPVYARAKKPGK